MGDFIRNITTRTKLKNILIERGYVEDSKKDFVKDAYVVEIKTYQARFLVKIPDGNLGLKYFKNIYNITTKQFTSLLDRLEGVEKVFVCSVGTKSAEILKKTLESSGLKVFIDDNVTEIYVYTSEGSTDKDTLYAIINSLIINYLKVSKSKPDECGWKVWAFDSGVETRRLDECNHLVRLNKREIGCVQKKAGMWNVFDINQFNMGVEADINIAINVLVSKSMRG